MRRVWATTEAMPFSAETMAAAAAANCPEVIRIPVLRYPALVEGCNEIPDPSPEPAAGSDVIERVKAALIAAGVCSQEQADKLFSV